MRRVGLPWAGVLLGGLFAAFLLLPTLALLSRGLGADFWVTLRSPAVLDALRVSLWTTGMTLLVTVVTGTPLAYLLARREFPGRALLDALLDLPVVLPPVVAARRAAAPADGGCCGGGRWGRRCWTCGLSGRGWWGGWGCW